MRKIFCFLLGSILFASNVKAEIVSGDDCGATENDVCHWSFDTDSKILTISGQGNMKNYDADGNSTGLIRQWLDENRVWKDYAPDVKSIVVEDGITSLGLRTFEFMDNVETIKIADSVQSMGAYALGWMANVKEIIMPASLEYAATDQFSQNYNLKNLYCSEKTLALCQNLLNSSSGIHLQASLYVKNSDGSISYYQNKNGSWQLTKKKRARIYTIEEASKLSKDTGNTVKLRYK